MNMSTLIIKNFRALNKSLRWMTKKNSYMSTEKILSFKRKLNLYFGEITKMITEQMGIQARN